MSEYSWCVMIFDLAMIFSFSTVPINPLYTDSKSITQIGEKSKEVEYVQSSKTML